MTEVRAILATATALALLAATPAAAIVKVATFSGTISSGYDSYGIFGTPSNDLVGAAYVFAVTYDKTLGTTFVTDGSTFERSSGGSIFRTRSPVKSVAITINGRTRAFSGAGSGEVAIGQSAVYQAFDSVVDGGVRLHTPWITGFYDALGVTTLDQNIRPTPLKAYFGFFDFRVHDAVTNNFLGGVVGRFNATATFTVRDAVPEPANWAMLIAGFGLVGATMRRRTMPFTT